MTQKVLAGRRALLRALAGVALISAPGLSPGQQDKPGPADAEKAAKNALTVTVTGDGKPIAKAHVKVTSAAIAGGVAELLTGTAGAVTFTVGPGAAEVRVIAAGWQSELQDFEIKEGAQQLTIQLKPLQ